MRLRGPSARIRRFAATTVSGLATFATAAACSHVWGFEDRTLAVDDAGVDASNGGGGNPGGGGNAGAGGGGGVDSGSGAGGISGGAGASGNAGAGGSPSGGTAGSTGGTAGATGGTAGSTGGTAGSTGGTAGSSTGGTTGSDAGACSDGVESNLEHGTEGPSCSGGLICAGVSCCQNTLVVGGTFPMGRSAGSCDAYTDSTHPAEQPEHDATVADFYLDTFEVTVGRFRRFVQQYDGTAPSEGAGEHPLIPESGWRAAWNGSLPATQTSLMSSLKCHTAFQTWTDTEQGNESYAITCVSWYEAFAFCAWDGGRLPTEAEWEYAAAGGIENRLFPWGQQAPTPAMANWSGSERTPFLGVGQHPSGIGRWGHHDLAGNMDEWTLDLWDHLWYATGGASCDNCANLGDAPDRVQRGGYWDATSGHIRAAGRTVSLYPNQRFPTEGFRCAR